MKANVPIAYVNVSWHGKICGVKVLQTPKFDMGNGKLCSKSILIAKYDCLFGWRVAVCLKTPKKEHRRRRVNWSKCSTC
jgi:hypothetical protein